MSVRHHEFDSADDFRSEQQQIMIELSMEQVRWQEKQVGLSALEFSEQTIESLLIPGQLFSR